MFEPEKRNIKILTVSTILSAKIMTYINVNVFIYLYCSTQTAILFNPFNLVYLNNFCVVSP